MTHDPVTTLADLDALDDDEIVDGYLDGRDDPREPGGNRSRAYWHGWRMAQMDWGRMEIPEAHRLLVRAYMAREGMTRRVHVGKQMESIPHGASHEA